MRRLHFGRIHDLEVRGGDPVFSPAPRILQDIKLGSDEGLAASASVLRKSQVVDLFAHLDELRDCTIETLEVKHGLPFRLIFELPNQRW
jgi:hypothetical protein